MSASPGFGPVTFPRGDWLESDTVGRAGTMPLAHHEEKLLVGARLFPS